MLIGWLGELEVEVEVEVVPVRSWVAHRASNTFFSK